MAIDPNELGPIEVEVEDGNAVGALKKLQKEIGKEGIIQKMKEEQFYTKPSKERHEERKRIKRMLERKNEEEEDFYG
jgi:ribosomal protein S21